MTEKKDHELPLRGQPLHDFCDSCPLCRPAVLDSEGKQLERGHPVYDLVQRVWDNDTTYEERKAFILVTWHNSSDPKDLTLFGILNQKLQKALTELGDYET